MHMRMHMHMRTGKSKGGSLRHWDCTMSCCGNDLRSQAETPFVIKIESFGSPSGKAGPEVSQSKCLSMRFLLCLHVQCT